jgi:hypothetical protein
MKQVLSVSLAVALLAACEQPPTGIEPAGDNAARPAFSALTLTDNQVVPISLTQFIPCANGGAGEDVTLTGNLHILLHITIANSGNVILKEHFQPQGITGLGSVSGDKYQGTGVTQDVSTGAFGSTFTFINNFRMIGQGPGNNFQVHENLHVTVNANGTLTSFHDNFSTTCK